LVHNEEEELISFMQKREKELSRVSRQWRDLQARKRFGFGHDTEKPPGKGELAFFCAACPQPGINLPENWRKGIDQWEHLLDIRD
jgi:hypothetical protein